MKYCRKIPCAGGVLVSGAGFGWALGIGRTTVKEIYNTLSVTTICLLLIF